MSPFLVFYDSPILAGILDARDSGTQLLENRIILGADS